ncbi:hypothetical protein BVC80_441g45 [Macleaya cordata]|uniref:Uncharacterized protein n=1 Tax=Macleaya cordata TaxID=56857 RepID=A0A200Q4A4_MACCD|nr:hypothetical protein BVC80_441g45 [Macleaya cordata]
MTNISQPVEAVRPLQGEEWLLMKTKNGVENIIRITQSLQKGPVTPPRTPSPCSTLPGKGNGGVCPIKAAGLMMNFAGHDNVVHTPPAAIPVVVPDDSGSALVVSESSQTQTQ